MQKRLEPYGLDLDQVNVRNVVPHLKHVDDLSRRHRVNLRGR